MRIVGSGLVVLVVVAACCGKPNDPPVKIENIERVFLMDDDRLLVFVRDEGGDVKGVSLWGDNIIVDDVPAGQLAWAVKTIDHSGCDVKKHVVLHVHSLSDVNGGGRSNQKYNDGMVVEVE